MAKGRGLCQFSEGLSCNVRVFSYSCGGSLGSGWGFVVGVILGFCRFVLSFCFLFLGVPFIYFLCT
jgi:hypothetical protein